MVCYCTECGDSFDYAAEMSKHGKNGSARIAELLKAHGVMAHNNGDTPWKFRQATDADRMRLSLKDAAKDARKGGV